ncbi:MAG: hypothetical protein IK058_01355 [Bacteroidales bacterium]|nr:hypothetical protein [Bacteroidales bacterium]
MKKILAIAVAVVLCQGAVMAQKPKAVAEKDVKVNYVQDFQRQVKDATNVQWWQMDSLTYKVVYLDNEKSRQAMVFTNKGSETHYYVEKQYIPAAIKDTVNHLYPQYTIGDVWVRKVRGNKMTYQACITKTSGFLCWKKVKDHKVLNWEVDGKYINAE